MATDAERRDVARRLREPFDVIGQGRYVALNGTLFGMQLLAGDEGTLRAGIACLADLIEPHRGSGGKTILCAHCESASWCGCEPGDEESGCDFEPSVTEGEPPYNLYSLYEAVLRRRPRDECAIEDDEVEELVDALLDICNAPGHEVIQRPQSSEPEVRCVAEAKIDGERLERLVHDAAVELTGIDRDALLALADEMEYDADAENAAKYDPMLGSIARMQVKYANRIREALGEGA